MGTSKWAFLLAVLTCIIAVGDCADEDSDLENYFKQKIDTFKLRLHEAFERARIQRHKRTVGGYNGPDDAGEFRFRFWSAARFTQRWTAVDMLPAIPANLAL